MKSEYNETIRNMIIANENLKDMLFFNMPLDLYSNKIVNMELFFLSFKLFEDQFKKLDIYDSWKELFSKQDYIIDGDKIIIEDSEISYQLIEITFLNLMALYKKERNSNIIKIDDSSFKKDNDIEVLFSHGSKSNGEIRTIPLKVETEDEYREDAISKLEEYKVDSSNSMDFYLSEIRRIFKDSVYDGIVRLYNMLKQDRNDIMFKIDLSTIYEDNKDSEDLIVFLLSFYNIHYYVKDKLDIRYDYLKMPDVEVDANHFNFDDAWDMLIKKLDAIDIRIDRLIEVRNRSSIKDKFKYNFKINVLERDKQRIMDQVIELSEVKETMTYDAEYIESFYSGELLNKHILYNLELAINQGYVDVRKNKQDKEELVFYAINGKEVDFIMHIELSKLKNCIDNLSIIDLFEIDTGKGMRKVLS